MNKYILTLLILTTIFCTSESLYSQKQKNPPDKINKNINLDSISENIRKTNSDGNYIINPAYRWNTIITKIRNGKISKQEAIDSIKIFLENLSVYIEKKQHKIYKDTEWVFPVEGYDYTAIGGRNGNGYNPTGFDFFDTNSAGHPAQDIFIKDKNQDNIDDISGKPVNILSMSSGIVIETRKNWTKEMNDIRGGNIVYVYDYFSNGLFYYAHLDKVFVNTGEYVIPGKILGTMGRTGKNAFPSRSPTHLHIMYLFLDNGNLIPDNIYKDLIKAKTLP
ncbi:MAG: M23 family peptidase [Ignavibacteria bacterium]|nr:M23 family peptidase [Ignavibacteria bacterium]